jgi:putative transcriptional regulator
MGKKVYDSILDGLDDAFAYAQSVTPRGRAHRIPVEAGDLRAAHEKLGLSQAQFAWAFRISPATLRKWEQGTRRPKRPARALPKVIEKEAVRRALSDKTD